MKVIYLIYRYIYPEMKYSDAVKNIIDYMEKHYKDSVTLEKLGEITSYSHIHITRLFKKETGQTPHERLTQIRINHARELLITDEKTLEEIAEECGFSSDSHFKILFKKMTGLTPGKYRKTASHVK